MVNSPEPNNYNDILGWYVSFLRPGPYTFICGENNVKSFCLFVFRFYGPVNSMGFCRAKSASLTTLLLGRLSPLSGLLVLCTFAKNWQLPFLNQRKWDNDRRKYFMINRHERMLPTGRRSNPQPPDYQSDAHSTAPPRPTCKVVLSNYILKEKGYKLFFRHFLPARQLLRNPVYFPAYISKSKECSPWAAKHFWQNFLPWKCTHSSKTQREKAESQLAHDVYTWRDIDVKMTYKRHMPAGIIKMVILKVHHSSR